MSDKEENKMSEDRYFKIIIEGEDTGEDGRVEATVTYCDGREVTEKKLKIDFPKGEPVEIEIPRKALNNFVSRYISLYSHAIFN